MSRVWILFEQPSLDWTEEAFDAWFSQSGEGDTAEASLVYREGITEAEALGETLMQLQLDPEFGRGDPAKVHIGRRGARDTVH